MTTPGYWYALAYWTGGMVVALLNQRRLHGWRFAGMSALLFALLMMFMTATDGVDRVYFIPCMLLVFSILVLHVFSMCEFGVCKAVYFSVQAFILGEEFLGDEAGAMILGDNIFYGSGFRTMLKTAVKNAEENKRATVFGYYVPDPERFGVVSFDKHGHATSIEEKPKQPKSNYAVTGLYFYPAGVSACANLVKPSARGELEITTLNEMYLNKGQLDVQLLGRGFAWLDTGTMSSLLQAANFVETIQTRQGIVISAPEEIAFINGFIDKKHVMESAAAYGKSPYGDHLKAVAEGRVRY